MLESAAWSLASTAAGAAATPGELDALGLVWLPAVVPGTVAESLAAAGGWSIDAPGDLDARDWWYRCELNAPARSAGRCRLLRLDGLATLADVWLNGQHILESANAFLQHRVNVSGVLRERNHLAIRFRALDAELAKKRPRPRWKTKLVRQQQLRWIRTSLLGRIPGWTPPVPAIGPWRSISIEERTPASVTEAHVHASLDGSTGVVDFSARIIRDSETIISGTLSVAGATVAIAAEWDGGGYRLAAQARAADAPLWWPHTHGTPELHDCVAELTIDGERARVDCGRVGFRSVEVDERNGAFSLRVNGVPVFCRGACWTTADIVSQRGADAQVRSTLELLRRAGGNMVRVGGTMAYERAAFYAACDELGLLVWQDFMFANMDYPADDPAFADGVQAEATQQLQRLSSHPSVAVYCGNSEVEQQAAMLGVPRASWRNRLFGDVLPALCAELHPSAVYVPSTPSGGALPFHTGTGLTHYYGVGAYMRPFSDVRRANVRFTPECLGFANVPEPATVNAVMQGDAPAIHDPRWKRGTPRDTGAGWDFEDVRDHYLRELFAVDPAELRRSNTPRYLELSRVATGETMSRVFAEWRREGSSCGGALVWFLEDLVPGAGWGIIDSSGTPKACYYYLRRAWQPQCVVITDEGLDGVHLHVVNETEQALDATLELTLLHNGSVIVARALRKCHVAPRDKVVFSSDEMLDAFYDVAYAYRFGPPAHDVTIATLRRSDGRVISEAFHFPRSSEPRPENAAVTARAHEADGAWMLTVSSDRFLYAAHLDIKGFLPDDNYFHLAPGREKVVRLRRTCAVATPAGFVEALNLFDAARITVS